LANQMLRACLEPLEKKYKMLTCDVSVDAKYELGGILEKLGNDRPVLFTNVKNHKMPVIGGMFGNREMFYDLTKTNRKQRLYKYMDAMTKPIAPVLLETGPVMEQIHTRNIDIGKLFPLPTFHELDASSFITAGVLVVKDPEDGKIYTSIRRFQYNGGNNLSLLVTSPLLSKQLQKAKLLKKDFECAIVLGYDHCFCLASQLSTSLYGVDKYGYDGALRGEPLELVKCKTVDLEVPAHAEIIIEGKIPWNEEAVEGPFGELMGYYGQVAKHPVMRVSAVMQRKDAIFQISAPCKEEHLSNGLIRDMEIFAHVARLVDVKDVNVTIGAGCRFHAVISIKKNAPGDGKAAILAALGSSKDIKHVVIVDEDIDVFDAKDVEGAIASRVQASTDVVIIPGANGTGLDPSHLIEMTSDKVGIDATKPLGEAGIKFEKAIIPNYDRIDLKKYFPNLEV
jgi:2,5-furandicarboxylate decarboxylase 1